MSKEDPKHGRWILPVVIVALIGFTYLFVNALPPAEIPVGTTSTTLAVDGTTTTIPDAPTTTTLPADIAAFLALVDNYETDAKAVETDVDDTNTAWENRADGEPSIGDTRDAFDAAKTDAGVLSENVTGTNPPDAYAEVWPDAVTAAAALSDGVQAVIDGLNAPDDGTERREAVAAYEALTTAFLESLDAVRAATP
ncbi:MAG: hypothetical protein ABFS21_06455 [Actinomycetota bacterium]